MITAVGSGSNQKSVQKYPYISPSLFPLGETSIRKDLVMTHWDHACQWQGARCVSSGRSEVCQWTVAPPGQPSLCVVFFISWHLIKCSHIAEPFPQIQMQIFFGGGRKRNQMQRNIRNESLGWRFQGLQSRGLKDFTKIVLVVCWL